MSIASHINRCELDVSDVLHSIVVLDESSANNRLLYQQYVPADAENFLNCCRWMKYVSSRKTYNQLPPIHIHSSFAFLECSSTYKNVKIKHRALAGHGIVANHDIDWRT